MVNLDPWDAPKTFDLWRDMEMMFSLMNPFSMQNIGFLGMFAFQAPLWQISQATMEASEMASQYSMMLMSGIREFGASFTGLPTLTGLFQRIFSTDAFDLYEAMQNSFIVMKNVYGSQEISQGIILKSIELARSMPLEMNELLKIFSTFSVNPMTRQILTSKSGMEKLSESISGLAFLVPEQGTAGAIFALREALTGQYRSLRYRFNIDPELVAQSIGRSFEEIRDRPELFLSALNTFLKQNIGERTFSELKNTFSKEVGNIFDAITLGVYEGIKNTGIYTSATTLVGTISNTLSQWFKSDMFTNFITDTLGEISIGFTHASSILKTIDFKKDKPEEIFKKMEMAVSEIFDRGFSNVGNTLKQLDKYVEPMAKIVGSFLSDTLSKTIQVVFNQMLGVGMRGFYNIMSEMVENIPLVGGFLKVPFEEMGKFSSEHPQLSLGASILMSAGFAKGLHGITLSFKETSELTELAKRAYMLRPAARSTIEAFAEDMIVSQHNTLKYNASGLRSSVSEEYFKLIKDTVDNAIDEAGNLLSGEALRSSKGFRNLVNILERAIIGAFSSGDLLKVVPKLQQQYGNEISYIVQRLAMLSSEANPAGAPLILRDYIKVLNEFAEKAEKEPMVWKVIPKKPIHGKEPIFTPPSGSDIFPEEAKLQNAINKALNTELYNRLPVFLGATTSVIGAFQAVSGIKGLISTTEPLQIPDYANAYKAGKIDPVDYISKRIGLITSKDYYEQAGGTVNRFIGAVMGGLEGYMFAQWISEVFKSDFSKKVPPAVSKVAQSKPLALGLAAAGALFSYYMEPAEPKQYVETSLSKTGKIMSDVGLVFGSAALLGSALKLFPPTSPIGIALTALGFLGTIGGNILHRVGVSLAPSFAKQQLDIVNSLTNDMGKWINELENNMFNNRPTSLIGKKDDHINRIIKAKDQLGILNEQQEANFTDLFNKFVSVNKNLNQEEAKLIREKINTRIPSLIANGIINRILEKSNITPEILSDYFGVPPEIAKKVEDTTLLKPILQTTTLRELQKANARYIPDIEQELRNEIKDFIKSDKALNLIYEESKSKNKFLKSMIEPSNINDILEISSSEKATNAILEGTKKGLRDYLSKVYKIPEAYLDKITDDIFSELIGTSEISRGFGYMRKFTGSDKMFMRKILGYEGILSKITKEQGPEEVFQDVERNIDFLGKIYTRTLMPEMLYKSASAMYESRSFMTSGEKIPQSLAEQSRWFSIYAMSMEMPQVVGIPNFLKSITYQSTMLRNFAVKVYENLQGMEPINLEVPLKNFSFHSKYFGNKISKSITDQGNAIKETAEEASKNIEQKESFGFMKEATKLSKDVKDEIQTRFLGKKEDEITPPSSQELFEQKVAKMEKKLEKSKEIEKSAEKPLSVYLYDYLKPKERESIEPTIQAMAPFIPHEETSTKSSLIRKPLENVPYYRAEKFPSREDEPSPTTDKVDLSPEVARNIEKRANITREALGLEVFTSALKEQYQVGERQSSALTHLGGISAGLAHEAGIVGGYQKGAVPYVFIHGKPYQAYYRVYGMDIPNESLENAYDRLQNESKVHPSVLENYGTSLISYADAMRGFLTVMEQEVQKGNITMGDLALVQRYWDIGANLGVTYTGADREKLINITSAAINNLSSGLRAYTEEYYTSGNAQMFRDYLSSQITPPLIPDASGGGGAIQQGAEGASSALQEIASAASAGASALEQFSSAIQGAIAALTQFNNASSTALGYTTVSSPEEGKK